MRLLMRGALLALLGSLVFGESREDAVHSVRYLSETKLSRGPAMVFNNDATSSISITHLSGPISIVCYQDSGNSNAGTCNGLMLFGMYLSKGYDLIFNADGANFVSATCFEHHLFPACTVCSQDAIGGNGNCKAMSVADQGLDFVFHETAEAGPISFITSAHFSNVISAVCYQDGEQGYLVRCVGLKSAGLQLESFAQLNISLAPPGVGYDTWCSLSSFSASAGVICFQDGGANNIGRCTALSITGSDLIEGPSVDFNAGMTTHISVTRLTDTFGFVCYRDGANSDRGTCNSLLLTDAKLTSGPDIVFGLGATSFVTATRLSATAAIVCYQDGASNGYGKCTGLRASGNTLVRDGDLIFNEAITTSISVTRLSDTVGVVCYHAVSGMCNAVRMPEPTTALSTTSTSSTTITTTNTTNFTTNTTVITTTSSTVTTFPAVSSTTTSTTTITTTNTTNFTTNTTVTSTTSSTATTSTGTTTSNTTGTSTLSKTVFQLWFYLFQASLETHTSTTTISSPTTPLNGTTGVLTVRASTTSTMTTISTMPPTTTIAHSVTALATTSPFFTSSVTVPTTMTTLQPSSRCLTFQCPPGYISKVESCKSKLNSSNGNNFLPTGDTTAACDFRCTGVLCNSTECCANSSAIAAGEPPKVFQGSYAPSASTTIATTFTLAFQTTSAPLSTSTINSTHHFNVSGLAAGVDDATTSPFAQEPQDKSSHHEGSGVYVIWGFALLAGLCCFAWIAAGLGVLWKRRRAEHRHLLSVPANADLESQGFQDGSNSTHDVMSDCKLLLPDERLYAVQYQALRKGSGLTVSTTASSADGDSSPRRNAFNTSLYNANPPKLLLVYNARGKLALACGQACSAPTSPKHIATESTLTSSAIDGITTEGTSCTEDPMFEPHWMDQFIAPRDDSREAADGTRGLLQMTPKASKHENHRLANDPFIAPEDASASMCEPQLSVEPRFSTFAPATVPLFVGAQPATILPELPVPTLERGLAADDLLTAPPPWLYNQLPAPPHSDPFWFKINL